MVKTNQQVEQQQHPWIALSESAAFIFSKKKLFGWSIVLVLVTIILTWAGFLLTTGIIDNLTGSFLNVAPATESIVGWVKYIGWVAAKWLFLIVSRIVAFFLAFLAAYSLSAPLYVFLSTSAEKLYCGADFEDDEGFTVSGILKDLLEGIKIGSFGIIVTIVALIVSFVPLFGQVAVFLLYTCYSTLLFIDYPASRRRWSLGQKLSWIRRHGTFSLKLGMVPAIISMIPLFNMFLMALIFPLFTVHATLNFYITEKNRIAAIPPSKTR